MPKALLPTGRRTPQNLFAAADFEAQRAFFAQQRTLAPTPLHRCADLARDLGIGELFVKDETHRGGLDAFKSVGASFAIASLEQCGEIRRGDTLVCASEGNHGRAVAHVARTRGYRARVYLSGTVSPARIDAIRSEHAEVALVDGTYDEAVRVMAREAEKNGWTIISDTSWAGYSEIPRLIMLGYTRIMDEDWSTGRPDAIFVPAGVGGLLAAVACWCDFRYGADRPCVVAVEPISAACVQESVRAGHPAAVPGPFTTTMGGLRCGEMSPSVFPAVSSLVDAYVAIEDEWAFAAMRRLAHPQGGDAPVVSGPSGAAALGGLLATLQHPDPGPVRERLNLGRTSRVLVLVTEGATDPALVEQVLARR